MCCFDETSTRTDENLQAPSSSRPRSIVTMAHGLWSALPDELVARIVDGAPPASLPVLLRLERRACTLVARKRLAALSEVWHAQESCHINHSYAPFQASDVLGVATEKALEIEVGNADQLGMKAMKNSLEAGAFSAIKRLSFLFSNLDEENLRLVLLAFAHGAMPQLEELQVHANFAGSLFMRDLSLIVASGGLPQLCVLDLSRNKIGDAGVEAFANAITNDGVLPRLYSLNIENNAPLTGFGVQMLITSLASTQSLPSLAELLVDKHLRTSNLRAVCQARGVLFENDNPLWMAQQHLARLFPGRGFETWQRGW